MNDVSIHEAYGRLKERAESLAGNLTEVPRRVAILTQLYLDSGRNHQFSLLAAHGALWALGYFEVGGSLGRLIARRYFYDSRERAFRLGLLDQFAEGFRSVNRQVCIDSYTNYYFSKQFGQTSAAAELVPAELLEALNRVHHASRKNVLLRSSDLKKVFMQSFHTEQEVTVAHGVAETVAAFDCPILRSLCLKPLVRFSYFPRLRYMWFRDFSNKEERIGKGVDAYDIAARSRWENVWKTLANYRRMPAEFFHSPTDYLAGISEVPVPNNAAGL